MPIKFNGTTITKLVYNGTTVNECKYNGTSVFKAEKYFTPSFTMSGEGWVQNTWPKLSVGRDEGDTLTGYATATIDVTGFNYLQFTPGTGETGYSNWAASRSGHITVYINNDQKLNMNSNEERTQPFDIDVSAYTGNVTLKLEISATWGYSHIYNQSQLKLHN